MPRNYRKDFGRAGVNRFVVKWERWLIAIEEFNRWKTLGIIVVNLQKTK